MVKEPIRVPVELGKQTVTDYKNKLSSVVADYSGANEAQGFDFEKMQKAILSTTPMGVSIYVEAPVSSNSPVSYRLDIIGGEKGALSDVNSVRINEQQYQYLTNFAPFENNELPVTIEKLNSRGTTNSTGKSPSGAHFTNNTFKMIKSDVGYKLTGDLVQEVNNPNKVWLRVYKKNDDGTTQTLNFNQTPLQKFHNDQSPNRELDNVPERITDAMIQELIKVNPK